jgi:hypothetical protein
MLDKDTKKVEKVEEMTPQAYAVVKNCESCDSAESRVKPYNPMLGVTSINLTPDQVQGVYFEEKAALSEASKLQKMYEADVKMLEEKRGLTVDKLTAKIEALEKERTSHFKSKNYDGEAEVAKKIQDLMDKLKKIEKAKKIKKKSEKEEVKKNLSEEMDTTFKRGDDVVKTGGKNKGENFRVLSANYDGTYLLLNLGTGKKLDKVKPSNIELKNAPKEMSDEERLKDLLAKHDFQYKNAEGKAYDKGVEEERKIKKLANALGFDGDTVYKTKELTKKDDK